MGTQTMWLFALVGSKQSWSKAQALGSRRRSPGAGERELAYLYYTFFNRHLLLPRDGNHQAAPVLFKLASSSARSIRSRLIPL
jgi:hypothetical protein